MNKKFGDEVSALLKTIIERCKKEKDIGCLLVPIDDYYERVSYYTAYPKMLIEEVTGVSTPVPKEHFDLSSHLLLMECMKNLLSNFPPTVTNLYHMFKEKKKLNMNYPVSTFCLLANEAKYEFRKTTEGSIILIENPKISFERFHYFKRMNNYRSQGKTIYYIDEKCIDANLSLKKPSPSRQNNDAEQTLFLMMSFDGYKNGLFTNQANEEVYKNWIENIVLPLLAPQSVIVLTNSYLHGHKFNDITMYNSKMQMMKWLRDKGIPYSDDMRKAELYDLIKKCTIRTKQSSVEILLKYHGHEVVHLPSTFEKISPIEFMWEHLQQKSILSNNENVYAANNKLHSFITKLDLCTWKSFIEKSEKYEVEIANLDKQIENNFESHWKLDVQVKDSCVCPFYHSFVAEGCKVDNK